MPDAVVDAVVANAARGRSRPFETAVAVGLAAGLALLANRLTRVGPAWLEYPAWALGVGLAANLALGAVGWRRPLAAASRSEFFLKTGLVLMGATVPFRDVLSVGARGLVQAAVLVSSVFLVTWYAGALLRLEHRLRAVMSAAVAIGGVSAAIAAAGAVLAGRDKLGYVTALVVLFAMPMMVLQPLAAVWLGLPADVAGAWIGGNIDTTAAVLGAGALHSERAMQVASIVKLAQNALIGVLAFLLSLYWVAVVERGPHRPTAADMWARFPKFVLGFAGASLVGSLGLFSPEQVKALADVRNWFLTLAFVSMGLELSFGEIRKEGIRPLLAYLLATAANAALALVVAWVLFGR